MFPNRVLPLLAMAGLLAPSAASHASAQRHHAPRFAVRAVHRAAPAGSFTSLRVESFAELKSQVRHDRAVRRRYAAFFHMPESAVPHFVDTQLYPMRLSHATTGVVYFVSPSGRFYSHPIRLKPGSRVFALRPGGQPALNFVCGNGFLLPIKPVGVKVSDYPPETFLHGADTPTDTLPVLTAFSPIGTPVPVINLVSPSPPTPLGGGVGLLPLAALGLLGIPRGHNTAPLTPVAVPEPDTSLLLLAALPLLSWVARRRQG